MEDWQSGNVADWKSVVMKVAHGFDSLIFRIKYLYSSTVRMHGLYPCDESSILSISTF